VHARVTLLEIDTMRASVPTAAALFEHDVLPALRSQEGYRGVYVLATPEGKAVLVSLWDTEEQADAGAPTGFYAEALARYVTLFAAPGAWEMAGITTSQRSLTTLGDRARPTTFWFALSDDADPESVATALESAFLDDGLEAQTLQDRLDQAVASSWTVNRLIQGFIGLGLVVGVVALGVVSARAVVERRQQIGVLRAIGFQPGMVRLAFLPEASFISLAAIATGCALGLITAYNVVAHRGEQQDVALAVPWLNLAVIFTVVYLASLASTLLPAIRASRVYPAEALRYE
jgi:hypothetical protein